MAFLDPDLFPYRQLHGAKGSLHPEAGPCFVCEGRFLVEAALTAAREGKLRILSVLAAPEAAEGIVSQLPNGTGFPQSPENRS